jgi:hypothetical protein
VALKETSDLVDLALKVNQQNIPLAIAALLPHAAVRTSLERKTFGSEEHQTTYGLGSHEMQIWYVSMMLAEYLAESLARRVREGRCNQDGAGHVPCAVMKAEHFRMLQDYRKSLEKLVDEIKNLEKTL